MTDISISLRILNGEADDELSAVADAVKQRESVLARNTVANLKPGDKITLAKISPKYLQGLVVEVERVNMRGRGRPVTVKFGDDLAFGRYAGSSGVQLTADMVGQKVA